MYSSNDFVYLFIYYKAEAMLLDEFFVLCKAVKEREADLLEKLDRMTEQLSWV